MEKLKHIPVLYKESAELFITDKSGVYIDATLGLGGHSKLFLDILDPDAKLIGLDTDEEMLKIAKTNLKDFKNIKVDHANFKDIKKITEDLKINSVNGVFFDFGFNSAQIEDDIRGLSFNSDGPLDMRFDKNSNLTAEKILNTQSYEELREIFINYGEERYASKIAAAVIKERKEKPLKSTTQLKFLIEKVIKRREKIHPATRTFQALRIAVNDELNNIKKALISASEIIKPSGRIAAISFHSLEDRIVKNFFKLLKEKGSWNIITKKPITASEEELKENRRSRSAKLRVIEKI